MPFFRQSKSQPRWPGVAVAALLTASSFADAYVLPRYIKPSQLLDSYDYVIVGGGTAGLTVADRLTEDPKTNVLVLEAGNWGNMSDNLMVYVAGRSGGFTDPMWPGLQSVPQPNLNGRPGNVLVAKQVGGGSSVNAMMNMRGSVEDYDRWAALFGSEAQKGTADWSWDGILPFFKKGLHFTEPPPELTDNFDSVKYDASYWGDSSEIYAGWPRFYYPGVTPLVEAFKEIEGVEFPPDSGAGQPGVFWFPTLMDPRSVTRSYAGSGHYLNVNATRPNYHLLVDTQVRRLVVDDALSATGVEVPVGNSTLVTVKAKKEVLLAAGAVHTPHLLQLSGIGPKKLLEAGGIDVRVDLPGVGQNFQDHSNLSGVNITLTKLASIHPNPRDLVEGSEFQAWAEEVWQANKTGPYSLAFTNLAGWLPFTTITDKADEIATKLEQQDFASLLPADTDATVLAGFEAQMKILAAQLRSKNTAFTRFQLVPDHGSQGPVAMQSFSRGTININTADPWNTEPVIDYRALTNPVEADFYVESIRFLRRYNFETSLAAEFDPVEYVPGPNVTSDADLKAYIAGALSPTDYHPVGTASMLPLELGGVVDQTLRVYGVKNLRVVDASVMPMVPGANTCQPTYALAEKAAEIIKQGI
ncbi:Putative glucose-methanol-choline oxidoreductase, FAD/NAD(P)-binding domain superfamily [Colletotrichum destructivum]|uniref:Glucose-methanol-choline oxidoreductase, FAD/NAD(P)-binding domain superfamily n=1 Tax=Colletotrichum destructivum TaxID=34406 RepID=A0AAX4ILK3_9PEZI|nr:Putative glucose-methanol-choline oxidoreductase, FAD/NAD(P)-binding domain superfamily [Colletotrichum destructivum]